MKDLVSVLPNSLIRLVRLILTSFVIVFFISNFVLAEESFSSEESVSSNQSVGYFLDDYQQPQVVERKGLWHSVFDFSWKLTIVVLLVVVTIKGLKLLYSQRMGLANESNNNFNMIDSFFIKPNQSIHIMEVAGKYLVIGSSPNSINLICELNDEEQIKGLLKNSFSQSTSFKDAFRSLMGNKSELEQKIDHSSENILSHLNKITEES